MKHWLTNTNAGQADLFFYIFIFFNLANFMKKIWIVSLILPITEHVVEGYSDQDI